MLCNKRHSSEDGGYKYIVSFQNGCYFSSKVDKLMKSFHPGAHAGMK